MRVFLPKDDPRLAVWEACQSPIEQWLCCGLFVLLGCRAVVGRYARGRLPELFERAGNVPACFLFSQHRIGIYRADFLAVAVNPENKSHRLIAIECDGKRYHSSPEQRRNDRRRNGIFVEKGYIVVRYTGSVLYRMMGYVLKEIQDVLGESGIACHTPPELCSYASLLAWATPNPIIRRQRIEAREVYEREERDPTFEGDDGAHYRWADTL
jgi:very-short-patch-repair endonuclease